MLIEVRWAMYEQRNSFSKETENGKNLQTEITELNISINELKNSIE